MGCGLLLSKIGRVPRFDKQNNEKDFATKKRNFEFPSKINFATILWQIMRFTFFPGLSMGTSQGKLSKGERRGGRKSWGKICCLHYRDGSKGEKKKRDGRRRPMWDILLPVLPSPPRKMPGAK